MEKLVIKTNGQWELSKAWGDPDYEQISHGNSPFKDPKSAQEAKEEFVSNIKSSDHAKSEIMPNIHTGENEMHVLLHRGIGGDYKHQIKPNGIGDNMLNWSNGKTVKTTTNSINTTHPEEASGHAKDPMHGHTIAFWVPLSSIHGNCYSVNYHLEPHKEHTKDKMHVMVAPGEYKLHSSQEFYDGKKISSK